MISSKKEQQRQTLDIVEDFACESKFLHFFIFFIFSFFFHFFIFFIFPFFSNFFNFLSFHIPFIFLSFSLMFFHFLSFSVIFLHCPSLSFIFLHFPSFVFHLSFICLSFVFHLSFICLSFVFHLSFICLSFSFIFFHFLSFSFIFFHFSLSFTFFYFHFLSFSFIFYHFLSLSFIFSVFSFFSFLSFSFIFFHFPSFSFIFFHFHSFSFIFFSFLFFFFILIIFHLLHFFIFSFSFIFSLFFSLHFSFYLFSFFFISCFHVFLFFICWDAENRKNRRKARIVKMTLFLCEKSLFGPRWTRSSAPLCVMRSWRNSWWKCRRSYPIPGCSLVWRRTSTFQFLVVEGESLVFKVFFLNRVQQRCMFLRNAFLSGLWGRSLISPFLVEANKIFAQDSVQPLLFTLQLVFMKLWMSLVKVFFALFHEIKKSAASASSPSQSPRVKGCPPVSAHPRRLLSAVFVSWSGS